MYELGNGKAYTSKYVGTGPSSYEKRIYRAAISQRLRNSALYADCRSELNKGKVHPVIGHEGPEREQTESSILNMPHRIRTYSIVQSPSWEANWFGTSQETPRISRNPKVHYRTHKRPPPVSILGQPNPIHIRTSLLLKIRSNIIRPSTPRSSQWSPSLRFPHQHPIHPLSSPIRATCPAHLILLDFITRTIYICKLCI